MIKYRILTDTGFTECFKEPVIQQIEMTFIVNGAVFETSKEAETFRAENPNKDDDGNVISFPDIETKEVLL